MLAKYKFISKRKITLLFIILHLCLQSFRQKMSNSITMRIVIQYRIQPQHIIYYRINILKKVMYKFWKPMSTYWSYLVGKTFLNKRLLSTVYIFFHGKVGAAVGDFLKVYLLSCLDNSCTGRVLVIFLYQRIFIFLYQGYTN